MKVLIACEESQTVCKALRAAALFIWDGSLEGPPRRESSGSIPPCPPTRKRGINQKRRA